MALAVIFLVIPVVIYGVLVAVPPGQTWRLMLSLVAAFLGYIWVGYLFSWAPLWGGTARADALMLMAANIYSFVAALAALTAVYGRRMAEHYVIVSYPTIALFVLLATFMPLIILLGV